MSHYLNETSFNDYLFDSDALELNSTNTSNPVGFSHLNDFGESRGLPQLIQTLSHADELPQLSSPPLPYQAIDFTPIQLNLAPPTTNQNVDHSIHPYPTLNPQQEYNHSQITSQGMHQLTNIPGIPPQPGMHVPIGLEHTSLPCNTKPNFQSLQSMSYQPPRVKRVTSSSGDSPTDDLRTTRRKLSQNDYIAATSAQTTFSHSSNSSTNGSEDSEDSYYIQNVPQNSVYNLPSESTQTTTSISNTSAANSSKDGVNLEVLYDYLKYNDVKLVQACYEHNLSSFATLPIPQLRNLIQERYLKNQRLARKAALAREARLKKKTRLEQLEDKVLVLESEIQAATQSNQEKDALIEALRQENSRLIDKNNKLVQHGVPIVDDNGNKKYTPIINCSCNCSTSVESVDLPSEHSSPAPSNSSSPSRSPKLQRSTSPVPKEANDQDIFSQVLDLQSKLNNLIEMVAKNR